jgi:protein-serine/threonine kinase
MTQLFSTSSTSGSAAPGTTEKRTFSGLPLSSNRPVSNSQVSQKIKNFFRINSNESKEHKNSRGSGGSSPVRQEKEKSSFRQSRFLPHIGRNRSTTVASEGHALDDAISPTANANPYFIHQGPPALRHHNEGSVPPSPPDTPPIDAKHKLAKADKATTAGKEELARKLRRVASAPNTQGLFAKTTSDDRPSTAELGKEPMLHGNHSELTLMEAQPGDLLPIPGIPTPGQIRNSVAFRRTYSSNSIKVRSVEVGPASFDKIKLIGKGDVGKVYLVREKKSSRLYAMKGESSPLGPFCIMC